MNAVYEKNIQLLTGRYRQDAARLRKFLDEAESAPKGRPPAVDIKLKERSFVPKAAMLFEWLQKDSLANLLKTPGAEELQVIYFVENNPSLVKKEFETNDWSSELLHPNFHFIFGSGYDDAQTVLYNSLKNPEVSMTYQNMMILVHPTLTKRERDFYLPFKEVFNRTARHYTSNLGSIADYCEGVRATVANSGLLRHSPGIMDLKGKYAVRPALLVGASPSLDGAIEMIKERENDFTIIAADASVKPLMEAGVKTDFAVAIERGNLAQIKFWEGLDKYPKDALPQLVAFPVLHEDSFKLYPGRIRIVYRNYAYYAGFDKVCPKGILHSYASCLHLGLRLASYIGAPNMILIGADMSYEKMGDNLYRSHAKGLAYKEWAKGKSKEWFEKNQEKTYLPYEERQTADGRDVLTNRVYRNWASQYELEAKDPRFIRRIIQCSEGSPALAGIPFIPFKEIIQQTPKFNNCHPKPNIICNPKSRLLPPYFLWREHLGGYARQFNRLVKVLDAEPTVEEIQSIYIYLRNMLHAEIFASNWIIQCSTREYYTCWNYINRLSLKIENDDEKERAARVANYKAMFTVLTKTVTMLVQAIEQGEKSYDSQA